MPWTVKKDSRCPAARPWGVVKQTDGSLEGCHSSKSSAQKQQSALYVSERSAVAEHSSMDRPHEGLLRADQPGFKLRNAEDGEMPIMDGQFADPGEWAEIKSVVEGHFFERFSLTAFEKTIRESVKKMRVLFHHGLDPSVGMKVLGPITELKSDTRYAVELLDTDYNRALIPGLRAGLYGSSFKFDIVKEDVVLKPRISEMNPDAIPEVTITEARVLEFGPTPLPAYSGTSAGVRSVTDEFLLASLQEDPDRLRVLVESIRAAALHEDVKPGRESTSPALEPQHSAEPDEAKEDRPSWFLE